MLISLLICACHFSVASRLSVARYSVIFSCNFCAVLQAALNWRICYARVSKRLAGFQGKGLHLLLWVFLSLTARKASQIVSVLFFLCYNNWKCGLKSIDHKIICQNKYACWGLPVWKPWLWRAAAGLVPSLCGAGKPLGLCGMTRSILTPINRCSCGGLLTFAASSHVLNLVSGGGSSVLRYFSPLTQKLRTKTLNILNSS